MERLKLKFLSVFEGLHRKGVLSEDELAEMIDLVTNRSVKPLTREA